MAVRAKMQCQEIASTLYGTKVTLNPVYADGGVNKSWSQATPSGKVEMVITNPAAFEQFKIGGYYFVDFTETTKEDAPPAPMPIPAAPLPPEPPTKS